MPNHGKLEVETSIELPTKFGMVENPTGISNNKSAIGISSGQAELEILQNWSHYHDIT